MDRRDFYFDQPLKENELDDAFAGAESAIWNLIADLKLYGLVYGGEVTPSVGVSQCTVKKFAAYDKLGRRLFLANDLLVDYTNDTLAAATVPSGGHFRWITIVARFGRNVSDARTDGAGGSIKFVQAEALNSTGDSTPGNVGKLQIISGVEAATANAAVRPSAGTNDVIIADLLLDDTGIAVVGSVSVTRSVRLALRTTGARETVTGFESATGDYVLLRESSADATGNKSVRTYLESGSTEAGLVFTVNAKWDGTTALWTADAGGSFGIKVTIDHNGLMIQRRSTTTGTWTDAFDNAGGWDKTFSIGCDGYTTITGNGDITGRGTTSAEFGLEGSKDPSANYYGMIVNFRRKLAAAPSSITFSAIPGASDVNIAAGPFATGVITEEGAFIDVQPGIAGQFSCARHITTVV